MRRAVEHEGDATAAYSGSCQSTSNINAICGAY
jgi:hypothetical protein